MTLILEQKPVAGNVHEFKLTATKNGAVWDLSLATVTLYLKSPTGAITSFAASAVNAAQGIMHYINQPGDLSVAGQWYARWKVVDGSVVQQSLWQPLRVYE